MSGSNCGFSTLASFMKRRANSTFVRHDGLERFLILRQTVALTRVLLSCPLTI